jgi:hypothetical protein
MTTDLIGSALDRVVHSKTFSRSRSLQDFLTFIVTQSLEPDQNLKEYRIGVDALKRGGAFDPAANSIVRVQAYRLRAKLADYYQHEGQAEGLRIDLEPGSYTPVIRDGAVAMLRSFRFPGVAFDFLPFDSSSAGPSPAADNAALLHAMVSDQVDLVLRAGLKHRHVPRSARAHLQLEIRARSSAGGLRTIAYLSDVESNWLIASHATSLAGDAPATELEHAAIEIASVAWQKLDALLLCNG